MRRLTNLALATAALVVTSLGGVARADSLRCGDRLVSEGDTALELKARCGRPSHIETRQVLEANGFETPRRGVVRNGGTNVVVAPPAVRRVRYTREPIETWLYAYDDGRLPQAVTVRRGRVARIQTLSRLEVQQDERCKRALHGRGTRAGVIQVSCGRPDDRAQWQQEEELEVNGLIQRRLVVHERWTYNPGAGRLLRILEFENGRLTKVSTGGRAP